MVDTRVYVAVCEYVHMNMVALFVCECVNMHVVAHRGWKRALELLESLYRVKTHPLRVM